MSLYNNTIKHHGVKGQKWGVRRYQNKDGSLTPAGKKRVREYDLISSKYKKDIEKCYDTYSEKRKKAKSIKEWFAITSEWNRESNVIQKKEETRIRDVYDKKYNAAKTYEGKRFIKRECKRALDQAAMYLDYDEYE